MKFNTVTKFKKLFLELYEFFFDKTTWGYTKWFQNSYQIRVYNKQEYIIKPYTSLKIVNKNVNHIERHYKKMKDKQIQIQFLVFYSCRNWNKVYVKVFTTEIQKKSKKNYFPIKHFEIFALTIT